MARKRKKGSRGFWITLLVFSLPCTVLAGFFGTGPGPEILIPYLTQQIQLLKHGLKTANNTLGAVRGLQEGIDRIRHYTIDNWMDDYIWNDPNVRGVRREWRTLQSGGSSSHAGMARLRRELYRLSSEDEDYRSIDHEGPRFRQVNVEEETIDVGDRLTLKQEEHVRNYDVAGAEIFDNASNAESVAEATKVGAEAQGILVRQKSDSLRLQTQQIRVSQAQLAHASAREREALVSHMVESAKLANAFLDLRPLR